METKRPWHSWQIRIALLMAILPVIHEFFVKNPLPEPWGVYVMLGLTCAMIVARTMSGGEVITLRDPAKAKQLADKLAAAFEQDKEPKP